jgi:hypothetical protein
MIIILSSLNLTLIAQDAIQSKDSIEVNKTHAEKKAERKELNKIALKDRRMELNTMFTFATMNSGISIYGPDGVLGVNLNLEALLGFKKNITVPIFNFSYSFTRHSSIYAEYYNISRNVDKRIDKEFEFGDITVPANTSFEMYVNTQIWSLGYKYSFINDEKANLSFFINIYIMGFGSGIISEQSDIDKKYSLTAPLPSLGYQFKYEILPKVRFGGYNSYFFLTIGENSGKINNFVLSMDYRILKWASLGATYSVFYLDIDSESKYFQGNIHYEYKGPGVFAQFKF